MKKLNSRQWKLYTIIKSTSNCNLQITVQDICEVLPNDYQVKVTKGNYTNCPKLYKDIDIINESAEVDYIIVKDNNKFYIGKKEDVQKYLDTLYRKSMRLLTKYWNVVSKMQMDGQAVIISHKDEPITEESKANRVIEAYKHENN